MAALIRHVRFYVPDEAAGSLLQLILNQMCAGCPISVGGEPPDPVISMTVYQADVEITPALVFSEIDEGLVVARIDLNAEAGPGYCDGHIEGPSFDDDEWKLIFDQATFETGSSGTAFGAALVADFGAGDVLIGIGRFDTPATFLEASGEFLKVTGTLPLPAIVPTA